jgi:hypothetical protein
MQKHDIQFDIGEKVNIGELERDGRIVAIYITTRGVTYEIRYFDNAEVKSVYFYADELTGLSDAN